MHNRVLVVATHPDDEILGCGGTVALHTRGGDIVHSIIVCEGESHRYSDRICNIQRPQAEAAANILGVEEIHYLAFPDQRLDTLPLIDVISSLEEIVKKFQPNIIYSQYGGDINRDHEIVFKAMLVACRPIEPQIQSIYAFETSSSTEWAYPRNYVPDTWIDISNTLDSKLAAMSCYAEEVRQWPHPRSLEALRSKAEAAGSQVCLAAAETYMSIRRVFRDGKTPY
jgi:LmbE family N-acetylglucosaminyl deacetylase